MSSTPEMQTPSTTDATGDAVVITVPARPEFFLVIRMAASAVATRCDFGVDDIDDLRLALDELCALCADGSTDESRMTLSCTLRSTGIDVSCAVTNISDNAGANEGERIELAKLLLGALVDDYGVDAPHSGVRSGWVRKERRNSAGTSL